MESDNRVENLLGTELNTTNFISLCECNHLLLQNKDKVELQSELTNHELLNESKKLKNIIIFDILFCTIYLFVNPYFLIPFFIHLIFSLFGYFGIKKSNLLYSLVYIIYFIILGVFKLIFFTLLFTDCFELTNIEYYIFIVSQIIISIIDFYHGKILYKHYNLLDEYLHP